MGSLLKKCFIGFVAFFSNACQSTSEMIRLEIRPSQSERIILGEDLSAEVLYSPLILIPWINSSWQSSGHLGFKTFVKIKKSRVFKAEASEQSKNFLEIKVPLGISGFGFYRNYFDFIKLQYGQKVKELWLEKITSLNENRDQIFWIEDGKGIIIKLSSDEYRFTSRHELEVLSGR